MDIYKAKAVADKQEEDPESLKTEEEINEYLNGDEVSLQIILAVSDAMGEGGDYAIPSNPSYETEPLSEEQVTAIRAQRETLLRGYLTADPFNYTNESLQEAMKTALEKARESDMMFMVLAIVAQVSEILNPETGAEKIADLGDAVKALPGDFMRFVGTAVVILRDSEWDGALLSLAKVPSNEEHKVSFMLKSTTNILLGFGGDEE